MKLIRPDGNIFEFDTEDYLKIKEDKWSIVISKVRRSYGVYKRCMLSKWSGNRAIGRTKVSTYAHNFILSHADRSLPIDHIDRNALNNKKSNLRISSASFNQMNKPKRSGNNEYKGIKKNKYGRYITEIRAFGKKVYVGTYKTSEEAAVAYDVAAIYLYGENASTNFSNCTNVADDIRQTVLIWLGKNEIKKT